LDLHQERDKSTLLPIAQSIEIPFSPQASVSLRFRKEKAKVKNFSLSSVHDHDEDEGKPKVRKPLPFPVAFSEDKMSNMHNTYP